MEIDKSVQVSLRCYRCRCNSFMNNLTIRELDGNKYLVKGNCIVCETKYNKIFGELEYRELQIEIILASN